MKTVTVTKTDVIKAIETETQLMGGTWIMADSPVGADYPEDVPFKHCRVCAVGAVFRPFLQERMRSADVENVIVKNLNGDHAVTPMFGEDIRQVAQRLLKEGAALNALSYYFEGQFLIELQKSVALTERDWERIRSRTIDFVREHFPETIEIQVPST
jgi:hypothetical protein